MIPVFRPPVTEPLYGIDEDAPADSFRVTRAFGDLSFPQYGPHDGLDIDNGGPPGDPILAIADGLVTRALFDPASGYAGIVRIDHGGGWSSGYAHLDQLYVQAGETVKQGQVIGLLGSTGWVTGPHLHFDISLNNIRQDPWPLLKRGNEMALVKADVSGLYGKSLIAQVPVNVRREPKVPPTSNVIVTMPSGSKLIAPAVVTGQFLETAAPGNQWYAVWVEERDSTIIGFVHDSTVREETNADFQRGLDLGYERGKTNAIAAVSKI